ncbi:MAG: hypothetical protein JXM70_06535 [Pirellulales bacterium]|nr:hypothetical protein [Pirellulales bacterium]
MTGKSQIQRLFSRVLTTLLASGIATAAAQACNTPVYRYAMYNWRTTPYHVLFFHNPAEKSGEAQKVNRLLSELIASQQSVNMELTEVDTTDGKSIDKLPEPIKKSWERARKKHAAKKSGWLHIIFSPWGRELYSGQLNAETLRSITESPAREQMGELLSQGKLVAVCLMSKNKANNRMLDKALAELTKQIESDSEMPSVEVARVDVLASDPKESWFVRNLMLAEPDLKDFADQPMLFMAYGRGRSMLPYIGKGISAENLSGCVTFLTGACSCEVKADNPGIDLLVRYDWEAAADALAATDDDALPQDSQLVYREFDPSQLSNKQSPESRKPELENHSDTSEEKPLLDSESSEETPYSQPPSAESFASRQTWILGGGLAFVIAVVVVGGLFFMRRSA